MENEKKIQLEEVQHTIHNCEEAVDLIHEATACVESAITAISKDVTISQVLHGSAEIMTASIVLHNIEKQLRQLV